MVWRVVKSVARIDRAAAFTAHQNMQKKRQGVPNNLFIIMVRFLIYLYIETFYEILSVGETGKDERIESISTTSCQRTWIVKK